MKSICLLIFMAIGMTSFSNLKASQKISLPLNPQLTRADLYVEPCNKAKGTLVLCPGRNGNGQDLIDNIKWINFARNKNLNLAGLSFASDETISDQGYFNISSGSGQILLDGLIKAFGPKPQPLLLYGFSRGAQFAYSFSRWKPRLVLAWCAYSASDWKSPGASSCNPRGIIACGEEDEPNYSLSMLEFLQGRASLKPWTWVSLAHTGHAWSTPLEDFVRSYFAAVLAHPQNKGLWMDVDTKVPVSARELDQHPTLAAWLPDENVACAWKALHQP